MAKGYRHGRRRLYKNARETVFRALSFAYRDRRTKKRDFRKLWIQRINAGSRRCGLSYSRFMHGLKLASVQIDRKVLADLAVFDFDTFATLVETAKKALDSTPNQAAGA
jgi:large subunit ribosomal protein L20